MPLDDVVLEVLICPITRSKLRQEGNWLVSSIGGLKYPVREGIPVLLPQEATLPEGFGTLDEFKQKFTPPAPRQA